MNIFKRIGSFATNSWKDFSEMYEQQSLDEKADKTADDPLLSDSFELKKRSDPDFAKKKAVQGFFRKRFSKKKLLLDDPRSPTMEFQRTPIQLLADQSNTELGILSPFNVQDMLDSIDSVVNTTPKGGILTEQSDLNIDDITINNKEFVENAFDWNKIEFNQKILSESLIVEVSTCEIKPDISLSNNEIEINEELCKNSDDLLDQPLLEENDKDENSEKFDCKVVGCIVKEDPDIKSLPEKQETVEPTNQVIEPLVASTPKKLLANSKLIGNSKTMGRSPLVSISNSPMVVNKNKLADNKAKIITTNPVFENPKKKKITSKSRQLPKAPSTPLTPLFKSTNKCISHFDKENY